MSDEVFADLKEAMEDAHAYERGERRNLKITRIQTPRRPKSRIKDRGNLSRGTQAINDRKE